MSLIRSLPRRPRPPYLRRRDLAMLLPLWPGDLERVATSATAHRRIVTWLHAALRHERRKGLAAHWDYDLSRHAALIVAFRAEAAALRATLAPVRTRAWRAPLRRGGEGPDNSDQRNTMDTMAAALT